MSDKELISKRIRSIKVGSSYKFHISKTAYIRNFVQIMFKTTNRKFTTKTYKPEQIIKVKRKS